MHVLLTGATGLVGQYLMRDLLLEGQSVAVLIRRQGKQTAAQRLERILGYWDRELGRPLPRPVLLEGDMSNEGLALSAVDRAWVVRHCRSVLHNAASLTFVGKDRNEEPWLSNFTGTANILEFCRVSGLREFHYMSTAYVCGKRQLVREDELDVGQAFRNDYEHCKFEAEKLVRAATCLASLTVYRPAVITGDSRTGYTATYHGFYSYIQFIWLMIRLMTPDADGRVHYPMRFNLSGDEQRNLVPVDWVSAASTQIFLNPAHHGRTYHLAPVKPVTVSELHDYLAQCFKFYGPVFIGAHTLNPDEMNDYEKMFYSYVARYEEYWSREPVFDSTNTQAVVPHLPCPAIDAQAMRRLIDFAVHDRFGKRRESRKEAGEPVQV